LAALLGSVGVDAVGTSTDREGQFVEDATMGTKVKATFAENKWVKGRDMRVLTKVLST
jgi:hypothetical protein